MSAIPIRMNFVTGTDKREKRHVRGFRSLLASHRNIKVPEYRLRCNPSPEKVRPFYSPYLIYIYITENSFPFPSLLPLVSSIGREGSRAYVTDEEVDKVEVFFFVISSNENRRKTSDIREIFSKFYAFLSSQRTRDTRSIVYRNLSFLKYFSQEMIVRD